MKKAFFLLLLFIFSPLKLWSLEVQDLKSKSGIRVWFVEDNSIPIVSMSFSFRGGSYLDKPKKEGTANLLSSLLDESNELFDSRSFQEEMKSLGMKLRFSVTKNQFSGTFQTISSNLNESFKLLSLALNKNKFPEDEIEKVRNQIIAGIRFKESDISSLSSKLFDQGFYKMHKFSRPIDGTLDSLKSIKEEDLKSFKNDNFSLANLIIGVSGNINSSDLLKGLDLVFGKFRETKLSRQKVSPFHDNGKGEKSLKKNSPQTSVIFGQRGLARNDKDFFALRLANYILGGGGFQSRLYKKIREQEGLVYSIYSYLASYENDGIIIGGFQTQNENLQKTIDLVKYEWENIKNKGVTLNEFEEAKSYFNGSFSRNFSSTMSIASLLSTVQFFDLGIDYFAKRKEIINQLSIKEINEVAKEMFDSDKLFFAIVGGKPNE